MRKLTTLLLSLLLMATAVAQRTQKYVVYEDFESGSLDSLLARGWQIEQAYGSLSWQLEASADAKYPTGSYAGNWQLSMRNTTGQTQGAVTRLISPVMDLSEVFHPMVVFAHAQAQRTGDVDELRVYYRTSAETRWVELAAYDKKITTWKNDTILLTGANATYQLMFEATDHFGRGVVLDEVIVRPEPLCEAPQNIRVAATTTEAQISWTGALDALDFDVLVTTTPVQTIEEADQIAPDQIKMRVNTTDYSVTLSSLERATHYYIYVRANCPSGETQQATTSFATKNVSEVPYTIDFNYTYVPDKMDNAQYWTNGSNISGVSNIPYINTNSSVANRPKYAFDSTSVLVFSGARNVATPIPAGNFVYGITPELDVDSLSCLQVRFWGATGPVIEGQHYTSRLIVGAMTNPDDFYSFVPVDTVEINAIESRYEEFTVLMNRYTGNGKYIAFVSDFNDADNLFYMDNLSITKAPAVVKPKIKGFRNTTTNSFGISAQLYGAPKVNVIVSKAAALGFTADPAQIPSSDIIETFSNIDAKDFNIKLKQSHNGEFVQVYIQGVDGTSTSEWSLPQRVFLPRRLAKADYPLFIGFEDNEEHTWNLSSIDNFVHLPYNTDFNTTSEFSYTTNIFTQQVPWLDNKKGGAPSRYGPQSTGMWYGYDDSNYAIRLAMFDMYYSNGIDEYFETGPYFTLPEVEDTKDVLLQFYYKQGGQMDGNSRFQVGVMTDIYDTATFVPVTTIEGDEDYRLAVVNFDSYKGSGKFIAFRAVHADEVLWYSASSIGAGYYASQTLIDNITLMTYDGCVPATDPKVTEVTDTRATITFEPNRKSLWRIDLNTAADMKESTMVMSKQTSTPTATLDSLDYNKTYYYRITTLCDGAETSQTEVYSFRTACRSVWALPYRQGFEDYVAFSRPLQETCIVGSERLSGQINYPVVPYLNRATGAAHSGDGCMSGVGTELDSMVWYFALPEMNDSLQKLQISFWMKAATTNTATDTLFIGVMSDPTDLSTFVSTGNIVQPDAVWREYIFNFARYTGAGRHIAVVRPSSTPHRYDFDDIEVKYIDPCEKVRDVAVSSPSTNGAHISWHT
ncbi:MAG: hypothetical protein IJ680_02315, partial [Paludibacteraceae bacterium]|nr:hypothetical protein [Paludibacteraceae bacterium]